VNYKGISPSLEAALSLLVLVAIILSTPSAESPGLQNLLILQKEHDLMRIWARGGLPEIEEMASDFKFAFGNRSGKINVNGRVVSIGPESKEAISAQMDFFDWNLGRKKVVLTVFK
jgi:hypothetical protein